MAYFVDMNESAGANGYNRRYIAAKDDSWKKTVENYEKKHGRITDDKFRDSSWKTLRKQAEDDYKDARKGDRNPFGNNLQAKSSRHEIDEHNKEARNKLKNPNLHDKINQRAKHEQGIFESVEMI